MILAALMTVGFTVVAALLSKKIDKRHADTQAQLEEHMRRLQGEVDAYQAGMSRAIDVFKQAVTPAPSNIIPFPAHRDYADAN